MGAEQSVSGHHADQGQRNRRHDDERRRIAPELGDDQQIDEDQPHPVGCPHVAKRLVGDLPFAVPLDGVLTVGVRRLADPVLAERAGSGQRCDIELGTNREQSIERRIELARHIPEDVRKRLQILGVQGLVDGVAFDRDQFGKRHHPAIGCPQRKRQQRLQADLRRARKLQTHRDRIFAVGVVHISGVHAG